MVDEALPGVGDSKHALHAKDVLAACLEQLADPLLQQVEIEIALLYRAQMAWRALVEAHARDAWVVLGCRGVGVEELGASLERALQVEAVDVEHLLD